MFSTIYSRSMVEVEKNIVVVVFFPQQFLDMISKVGFGISQALVEVVVILLGVWVLLPKC